ncbi:MAG: hypothetical protein MUC96_30145 [Myxococcaceae bacterium]|nr:hypothetical protein [Myxococcaceae bacterium]
MSASLMVGCSSKSEQVSTRVVDEVPRYLGVNLKVVTPEGQAEGQGHVKLVDGYQKHRLDLYLRATGQVERGTIAMNVNLPFDLVAAKREENGVTVKYQTNLTYQDVLTGSKPQFAWTLRAPPSVQPEEGTNSPVPSGSLPEEPSQRPAESETFLDVGGPAIVAGAELVLNKDQEIQGFLTVVPMSALDLSEGTLDSGKVYNVGLSGRVEVGCLKESEFAASAVGLSNSLCASFFSDFVGPIQ